MTRIDTFANVKPGDVLIVEVTFPPKKEYVPGIGERVISDRQWRRFVAVSETPRFVGYCEAIDLIGVEHFKRRQLNVTRDACYLLPEDEWPQGVVVSRMAAIMSGELVL